MPPSSGADAPKHFSNIRRSRPSYSCENCRARRVKCDQVHPRCSNCVRNQVDCVYTSVQPKRKCAPVLDQEATSVRRTSRQQDDTAETTPQGYLVTQTGGRSRYIEKTFWASVDSEGLELDSLLSDLPIFPEEEEPAEDDEEDLEEPGESYDRGPSNFWTASNHLRSVRPGLNQVSLLARLPPESTCIRLYNIFLEGVHPLIPLIHITSFEESFKRFWEWYNAWDQQTVPTGILIENPSFLPLLLAVLFTGSLARTKTNELAYNPLDSPKCATTVLYKMTLAALSLVAFPQNPGLHSLMAYVLVNAMLIREEEALSSCSFVALAIRIAQAMGLHKDGSAFRLDPIQVEERRRLWAQLMHLDVMTACFTGLPLVASSEMYSNTKMMSELSDEYIGSTTESTDHEESSEMSYPGYLLALGRYEASTMMRKILLRQFSPDPLRLVHIRNLAEQIELVKAHLHARISRLEAMAARPPLQGLQAQVTTTDAVPAPITESGSVALVGWSIKLLELMIEKAYCVLYQPIISESEIWRELRADAIPHYQNYIEVYLTMSTSPMYQPFQWLYPQSYQPLHPTAVLLIDCMKENNSAEMTTSTNIIERIFSFAGPEGRITNGSIDTEHGMSQFRPNRGASKAWHRLAKLRARVWNRLGINDVAKPQTIHHASLDGVLPRSGVKQEVVDGFVPVNESSLTSGNIAPFGSPDVVLYDELSSFSQSWFPNSFYSVSVQDPLAAYPGSSAAPISLMMPEVAQYDWTLDPSMQPAYSNGANAQVPNQFQY